MKYALLQTAIGDYRQNVLEELCRLLGGEFHVFTGASYFTPSVKTDVHVDGHLSVITNHFLGGRRLLWQTGMWRPVLKAQVVVMEGNPRILSSWLILALRRLLRRKSVLWMHAWPRAGRTSPSDSIRHLLRLMAHSIIVYTETQALELRERMPRKRIVCAPNAILRKESIYASENASAGNFIYVGRLVEAKKPMLLLQAFQHALPSLPDDCQLLIIGEGPQRDSLSGFIDRHQLGQRVRLPGHIADESLLRTHYATAIASVSPGYAGLSLTQSFSYGIAMIISRSEPHAPEIEAAEEGVNCEYFTTDSIESLSAALVRFGRNRMQWIARRAAIAQSCARKYSVEVMAGRIVEAMTQ